MLSPDYLQHVADEAVELYSKLEERIIKDIARRIIGAGTMTESARWQIKVSQESGKLYDEIIDEIAKNENISRELIQQIFEDASIESLNFDDEIYKAAGLNPIPIKQSEKMLKILTTTLKQTNSELYNLTRTTADSSQEKFLQACDNAYMDVVSGAFDYNTAIFNAVEEISKSGVEIVYPSGRKDKVDVAVRRNLMTSISQTTGEMQIARMDEMECDLVEVSAHSGARPSHALWQGQVYSRSGTSKKYPDFVSCTGYGTVTGLKGINCRHDFYPFFDGLSKRAYTDEEIDKINNETVTYNNEKINKYDATQMQRKMERAIRQNKREIAGYEGIILESKDEELIEEARSRLNNKKIELKQNQETLKDFINQTGLARDRVRERINQFDKDIPIINKKSTNKIKDDIITTDNLLNKLNIDLEDYKPFGKYDPIENTIQENTAELLGMDKTPQIVNSKTFEEIDGQEIVRIVHSYHGKTAQEAYDNTIKGKIQYSERTNSSYGRGIYFGEKIDEDALVSLYGKAQSKTINAKIANNAKILEFGKQLDYLQDVEKRLNKVPEKLKNFYKNEKSLLYMLDGVDGIKIRSKGYYCIYNRGVLIISE